MPYQAKAVIAEWIGVDLLHAYMLQADGQSRIFTQGPDVQIPARAVSPMAMALHELATNAVKYGAMSSTGGRLHISWRVNKNPDGTGQRLNVDWRETGANTTGVSLTISHSGYGRELIERALPYQLNARTLYGIGPDGVHCVIDVPISGMFRARDV